jgi:hypothetical protein
MKWGATVALWLASFFEKAVGLTARYANPGLWSPSEMAGGEFDRSDDQQLRH